MQPAAILELRFERARARDAWPSRGHLIADYRLASGSDNRLVRRANRDRFVRQVVKLLKIRIAEHKAIVRVPQYERFGDGLDSITQAHVGSYGLFGEVFLLGDVDGYADQMESRFSGLAHQLAACAEPYPVACGVTHAKRMIDCCRRCVGEFSRELVQLNVVRMHQRIHIPERKQIVFCVQSKNFKHRLRPEDSSSGKVPVPKSAAAAVERSIDPAADGFVDEVGLPGSCRLPMKSES